MTSNDETGLVIGQPLFKIEFMLILKILGIIIASIVGLIVLAAIGFFILFSIGTGESEKHFNDYEE
jgi:hypothetical protein